MILTFDTRGNEKQKQCARAWADPTIAEITYGGAKGGAKSFTGCKLIFHDALVYDGTHYFIARKKLNDLRKFTIPSIHECFEDWGLRVDDYMTWNGQDSFYQLHNGSRVYLLEAKYLPSDPQYMRFGSMQMTRGWIEEAGEFEADAKANLQASVGRWKNDVYNLPPKLLQTCNPSKNYLYQDYKAWLDGSLPKYKAFIQALPTHNKKLPKGYIENLERSLSKAQKERLLYGNWEYDDDPATLIDYDRITDIFTTTAQRGNRYITADIARLGDDSTTIYVWDGLCGTRYRYEKKRVDDVAKIIRELQVKFKVPNSHTICDEDGIGGGVVDILRCKGFVNNSRPLDNPKTGKPENFANLKSQCYFKLAEYINDGKIQVIASEGHDRIIEELEYVKQADPDTDGKRAVMSKDKVKSLIGRSPDDADALMMRMYFELKKSSGVVSVGGSRVL